MAEKVLTVKDVRKHFPVSVGGRPLFREQKLLKAVDGISFSIGRGETLGLVGESGCGKSTLARLILKLIPPTEGQIFYGDTDVTSYSEKAMRPLRRQVQMIFQDPYASLNPRRTVRELLRAPLRSMDPDAYEEERIREMLDFVGLPQSFAEKYPHEMSGGQRQRVAIARAMIARPALVVCDEPVNALDVSVRGQILNLMKRFQREKNVSYLLISHDLGTVRSLCHRVEVMYLGKIVEQGTRRDVLDHPVHPYTQALLSAEPVPEIRVRGERVLLRGEVASAIEPPVGCAFHTRCVYATEGCSKGEHTLTAVHRADGSTHASACPRYRRTV